MNPLHIHVLSVCLVWFQPHLMLPLEVFIPLASVGVVQAENQFVLLLTAGHVQ